MTLSSDHLPEFDAPPVAEVVLAVAFEPTPELSNVALTETWIDLFRGRFPRVEEKAPYGTPFETFGSPSGRRVHLEATSGPPPVRLWLIAPTGGELIQMQNDWFARNWRKAGDGDAYPRYERHIRPAFEDDLNTFLAYVAEKYLVELVPMQCEVTYINHIARSDFWIDHSDVAHIFRGLDTQGVVGEKPESVALRATHLISDADDPRPLGRLHTQIDSAYTQTTGEPLFAFNLTARGAPVGGKDAEAVLRFLDIGRDRIVTRFAEATTDDAHRAWRRTR